MHSSRKTCVLRVALYPLYLYTKRRLRLCVCRPAEVFQSSPQTVADAFIRFSVRWSGNVDMFCKRLCLLYVVFCGDSFWYIQCKDGNLLKWFINSRYFCLSRFSKQAKYVFPCVFLIKQRRTRLSNNDIIKPLLHFTLQRFDWSINQQLLSQ